ncbi:MAG: polysaccharide biosynthesis/export family protein [Acidobacteria bacterium]|nr:polysaccharide biosynthesis/export family protein [Acidobacteriota bacterium]MCW5969305.1 polysaccharide biosynthesis/export family protein [Blastocatellales bacterium]
MRKIQPILKIQTIIQTLIIPILIAVFLIPLPQADARFQEQASVLRAASGDREQRYRIGVGDVLIIRVFGHPDLGGEVPVNSLGNIRLPFFDEIPAACRTESDLAASIAERMRKYLRDPQVDVIVKEYRSQPVAVMGAVAQPGRFLLQRRVRLLELLANAGGPAPNAGSTIFVIHSNDLQTCDTATNGGDGNEEGNAVQAGLTTYKLKELMTGSPEANRFVEPGDIVSIPEADQVFLTGNILRPGPVPLKGQLTLLDAIAMAGGFQAEASKKNVRLIRHDGVTGTRKESVYNVEDIEKRRADDVLLQPNDIVAVSSSAVKNLRKSLLQIVPATVSTLPLVILP